MQIGINLALTQRNGGAGAPALNIDFAGTGVLPSTVTFSRGTNATLTDSNGRIAWAPHNLLTNSEDFEAAAWTKGGGATIVANATTAPDGTATADKLRSGSVGGEYRVQQSIALTSGVSYTFSGYVKRDEWKYAFVYGTGSGVPNAFGIVDLDTGAITTTPALGVLTATAVGNNWYRIVWVFTSVATASDSVRFGTTNSASAVTSTGNGTDGIFIWGAQLNVGSTAQSYNSTTPKNLLGFTQEPENAAWTKSNSYVQQNLLTWSQDFDNAAWGRTNATLGAAVVAPSGTTTGSTLIANASGGSTQRTSITFSSTGAYTASLFVKRDTVSTFRFRLRDTTALVDLASITFDLATGFVSQTVAGSGTITPAGNDWYRCTITGTVATASNNHTLFIYPNNVTGAVNGDSILIWGAQLVQGSTAGDYTQTTSAAAPTRYLNWDGTLTGKKLVENTATNTHYAYQTPTLGVGVYTLSVYLKAAERTWALINVFRGSTFSAYVNLSTGELGFVSGGTATVTNAGNGWWRAAITFTVTVAGASDLGVLTTTGNGTSSYTGDGTSGIYVSDFQLSNSASVDPYVYNPQAAAASAAYYGPRFDYDPVTLASRGLLIEEQRTNLLTYSQDFSNATAWPPSNITVTNAATTAPDGTNTAQSIAATTTASTLLISAITTVSATSATYSVYAKQGTGATSANTFILRNHTTATNLLAGTLNYSTGVFTYTIGSTGVSVQNVGNGWWRLIMTVTSGVTSGDGLRGYVGFSGASETAGTFLYAWGAQLEAGSFAYSYIPTVASQVTRNADSASMLGDNFYTWYNPNQGTLSGEASRPALGGNSPIATVFSATNTRMQVGNNTGGGGTAEADFYVQNSGVDQAFLRFASAVTANVPFKIVGAYNLNNFGASANGAATLTDTSGTVPVATSLLIGASGSAGNAFNGHIRRIGYYNTRLPNATLQALTT